MMLPKAGHSNDNSIRRREKTFELLGMPIVMSEGDCDCTLDRLLLKAVCRWDENCTIGVENLVFEAILVAFSSIFRPET